MNQVVIANFMVQAGKFTNMEVDENLFRHMVINSVRTFHKKYSARYGEMVLAFDGPSSWRKEIFPYYKASRKKARSASDVNWTLIFKYMDMMRQELAETFPYPVVHMAGAEADDVIGTLVRYKEGEQIMILSGDKDFIQLHNQIFVSQYDPIRNRDLTSNDASAFLKEHIVRGDSGDGIPNILSKDDTFVSGTRSKSITQGFLAEMINRGKDALETEEHKKNFDRNTRLIDLSHTPKELQKKIIDMYEASRGKSRAKLLDYFIQHKMKNLIELLNDF